MNLLLLLIETILVWIMFGMCVELGKVCFALFSAAVGGRSSAPVFFVLRDFLSTPSGFGPYILLLCQISLITASRVQRTEIDK